MTNKNDRDIVVSTRVRLARSLDGLNFTPKMKIQDYEILNKRVLDVLGDKAFEIHRIKDKSPIEKQSLIESHYASKAFVGNQNAVLLTDDKNKIYIMVGEEDHIRLQCILEGLQTERADELTSSVDNILSEVGYAFDTKLGYLTACPTNLGTGMRASVMMHLPASSMSRQMKKIVENTAKFGYTFRGYYGEGTTASGNMYQLSNQITLGVSEDKIISGINQIARTLINNEFEQREKLLRNERTKFTDKLYRSFGTLKHARSIDDGEMMGLLSDLRLGLSLGIFSGTTNSEIENLIFQLQPATLFSSMASDENININIKRASILRDTLANCSDI